MPDGLDSRTAMIVGTAGFTAALAIDRMEQNDQTPEMGPVVVTGASGGVGSFAISMLAHLGYEAIAVSGREKHREYLKSMGASSVKTPALEEAKYAGVIDNVGGDLLSSLLAHIDLWGNVACIGMAADHRYQSTVFPMILRGVSMLGASSANCPMPRREKVWKRIGSDLLPENLESIVSEEVSLKEISPYFNQILERKHRGRIIVKCN